MKRRARWIGLAVAGGIVALAVAWAGWTAYQVNRDLTAAVDDVSALRAAVEAGDDAAVQTALDALEAHSGSAAHRTDGPTWAVLSRLPVVGDDATGVAVVSGVARDLAGGGLDELIQASRGVDRVVPQQGGIDLDEVARLRESVAVGGAAFADADARLRGEDSSGYVGRLQVQYDDLADQVAKAAELLAGADTALQVMPDMLGQDGPKNYLLIFQNNAEIRATGGLSGSWARLHADDGRLSMREQGDAVQFGQRARSILPLSAVERQLWGSSLGTFFQGANFTQDFARAAQLWAARWEEEIPGPQLDGVIALDPVAMSYLLRGTGDIAVEGQRLTSDNLVDELLNRIYLEESPEAQDEFFTVVARSFFDTMTGGLASPQEFVGGLSRSAREGRLLVRSFDESVQEQLRGSRVEGATAATDDPTAPQIDVTLNDATGSKMSYYLRYRTEVEATGCVQGSQRLSGSMTLRQSISPRDARALPESVTGPGTFGTERGMQLVLVNLFAPEGGTIEHVNLDGRSLDADLVFSKVDGRPVTTVAVRLSNRDDVLLTWQMQTGEGQDGDGVLWVTPGVAAGDEGGTFASACDR